MADPPVLLSINVAFRVDGEELQRYIDSPDGPVVQDLIIRSQRVWQAARNQVRIGHVHAGGSGSRPNLKYSIVRRIDLSTPGKPRALVGSDNPIALLHHEGTRPHIIEPRRKLALRFFSTAANGVVFSRRVHHPGTKPNRYLTDNLPLAAQ